LKADGVGAGGFAYFGPGLQADRKNATADAAEIFAALRLVFKFIAHLWDPFLEVDRAIDQLDVLLGLFGKILNSLSIDQGHFA